MKRFIIAMSRAYGSGGNSIARALGSELGIPYYERAIIEKAAEKSGLSVDYMDKLETSASRSFLFNLVSSSYATTPLGVPQYDVPVSHTAFAAQSQVIHELAEHGSCIIVGRCADYILRDDPDCVKVFIYADKEDRIKAAMNEFNLDRKAGENKLDKIDKGRSNYYKTYTGENWGQLYKHDICLNTSKCGIEGAVQCIVTYLRALGKVD